MGRGPGTGAVGRTTRRTHMADNGNRIVVYKEPGVVAVETVE